MTSEISEMSDIGSAQAVSDSKVMLRFKASHIYSRVNDATFDNLINRAVQDDYITNFLADELKNTDQLRIYKVYIIC